MTSSFRPRFRLLSVALSAGKIRIGRVSEWHDRCSSPAGEDRYDRFRATPALPNRKPRRCSGPPASRLRIHSRDAEDSMKIAKRLRVLVAVPLAAFFWLAMVLHQQLGIIEGVTGSPLCCQSNIRAATDRSSASSCCSTLLPMSPLPSTANTWAHASRQLLPDRFLDFVHGLILANRTSESRLEIVQDQGQVFVLENLGFLCHPHDGASEGETSPVQRNV